MKIFVENLTFKCIIGLLKKERKTPQKVILDMGLTIQKEKMAIDYAQVATFVEHSYKKSKYFTVEDSLVDICGKLKAKFPQIKQIKIKITKPKILKNCRVGAVLEKKY